ncbi:hypothetical protein [Burkholderia thailandensis]|uniref:hypothetical protein n=1 Tax=Burkholderia thailandensis TaxID=57975 RepID=UPI0003EC8AE0|nr:hypothetical protein [Burkholderia thailandensis]AHI63164.1 sigma-70, region 4 family protein [Burkholderia thailandensis H0587]MCZ2895200.1 hypothetical protein [Burkholderia thailandensis]TGB31388.1 hypothetical protein C6946_23430 [Burkholderia thailandensis]
MTKERDWIGHPSAQRRQRLDGTYEYADPQNQSLAIMLGVRAFHPDSGLDPDRALFSGANLWEIDRFVEELEANMAPDAEKFRAALNEIRMCFKNDDTTGNVSTSLVWRSLRAHAEIISVGMRARAKGGSDQHGRDVDRSGAAVVGRTPGAKWSNADLMQLLEQSKLPEMTQRKLADRYGVSRARIGALLKDAKAKLSTKPVSAFTYGGTSNVGRKRRVG